jgi:hypothetical protein
MRRSLAGLALGAGASALLAFRWRVRRRRPEPPPDPADELKRKLAATRAGEPAPEPETVAEPAVPPPGADERRRAVHERGRAAIERMRGGGSPGE